MAEDVLARLLLDKQKSKKNNQSIDLKNYDEVKVWQDFVTHITYWGKSYGTIEEYMFRFRLYEKNNDLIS